MTPLISLVIPSIRPHNLDLVFDSVQKACKNHEFEIVVPSPYSIPEKLMKSGRVKFIHTYGSPSCSAQIGFNMAIGKYVYHSTDDGLFQEGVIDKAIDFIKTNNLRNLDVLNMRYVEDSLNIDLSPKIENPQPFPDSYWKTRTYPDFYLQGINPNWDLCPHFFMERAFLNWLGGLDTNFEYINWNLHDFSFRVQAVGGKIFQSPFTAFLCSHLSGETGDHFAPHQANDSDKAKFREIYSKPDAVNSRIQLPLDNWKSQPQIWARRFDENTLKLSP